MIHAASSKSVIKASAATTALDGTYSHEIDTLGFAYATVDVVFSPFTAAASPAATVLRLAASDASGSGQTNLSGFVGGTDFTVANGTTTGSGNNGHVTRFNVDLRGRPRYLTVYATPKVASVVSTVAHLSRGDEAVHNATDAGVGNFVNG